MHLQTKSRINFTKTYLNIAFEKILSATSSNATALLDVM